MELTSPQGTVSRIWRGFLAPVLFIVCSAVWGAAGAGSAEQEADTYEKSRALVDSLRQWVLKEPPGGLRSRSPMSYASIVTELESYPWSVSRDSSGDRLISIEYPEYLGIVPTSVWFRLDCVAGEGLCEIRWLPPVGRCDVSDSGIEQAEGSLFCDRLRLYQTLPLAPAFQPTQSEDSMEVRIVARWRHTDTLFCRSAAQLIRVLRKLARERWVYVLPPAPVEGSAGKTVCWGILITSKGGRGHHYIEISESYTLPEPGGLEAMRVVIYPYVPTDNVADLFAQPPYRDSGRTLDVYLNRAGE